jgi:hypothetical protein
MGEDQFCADYARRECEKVGFICALPAADCQPVRVAACKSFLQASRSDARMFRAANADACLEKVSATYSKTLISSDDLAMLHDVCARVLEGRGVANDVCKVDYDCERSLVCDKGRCGPRRIVSRSGNCGNPGERCMVGEYCRPTDGLWICTKKKDRGTQCSAAEPCLEAYRCTGVCEDKLELGSRCTADDDCKSAYCSPEMGTCGPGLAFAPGAPSCTTFGARPWGGAGPDAGAPAADAGGPAPDAPPASDDAGN